MKFPILVVSIVLLVAGVLLAQTQTVKQEKVQLTLSGLHCNNCATKVEKALRSVEGVKDVTVSLEESSAEIVLASAAVKPDLLVRAVADAGYEAEVKNNTNETAASKKQSLSCCAKEKAKEAKAKTETEDCCAVKAKPKKSCSH
jgi:copper chaperone CopZ